MLDAAYLRSRCTISICCASLELYQDLMPARFDHILVILGEVDVRRQCTIWRLISRGMFNIDYITVRRGIVCLRLFTYTFLRYQKKERK